MVKTKDYVGELIRMAIKAKFLNNTYVIQKMKAAGIDISDTKFSNKIYGVREQFTQPEVDAINLILEEDFKI